MSPKQLADYSRYLERLSSDASIAQTMIFDAVYKEKYELAIQMITENEPDEKIFRYSRLPVSLIEKLRKELKG